MGKKKKKELDKLEKLYNRYNQCRDLELDRFWKNSVFVWVFLALCFTAFGALVKDYNMPIRNFEKIDDEDYYLFLAIVSGIGLFLSFVWVWMARGLKAWYEVFEMAIWNLETNKNVFDYPDDYTIDNYWTLKKANNWFEKHLVSSASFSTSKIVILIGCFLVALWFGAFGYSLGKLFDCSFYWNISFESINIPFCLFLLSVLGLIFLCKWFIRSSVLRKSDAQSLYLSIKSALKQSEYKKINYEVTNSKVKFWGEDTHNVVEQLLHDVKANKITNQEIEFNIGRVINHFAVIDKFIDVVGENNIYRDNLIIDKDSLTLANVTKKKFKEIKKALISVLCKKKQWKKLLNQASIENGVVTIPLQLLSLIPKRKICRKICKWICNRLCNKNKK